MPTPTHQAYSFDQLMSIVRCPKCQGKLQFQQVEQGLPNAREYGVLSCRLQPLPGS